jgi:hypothetical protein
MVSKTRLRRRGVVALPQSIDRGYDAHPDPRQHDHFRQDMKCCSGRTCNGDRLIRFRHVLSGRRHPERSRASMAYSDNLFPLSARNEARNITVSKIAAGHSEKTQRAFPSSYLAVVPPQAGLFSTPV